MIELFKLPKLYKQLLLAFLFLLTAAVLIGLTYVYQTTHMHSKGIVERYAGSSAASEDNSMEVPEQYAKPVSEMLMTTHNHLFGFSLIFLAVGGIFAFNSIIKGRWKVFLIVEPFFSTFFTFASFWGIRYVHTDFTYLTVPMAVLTYGAYFVMAAVIVFELMFKKNPHDSDEKR